MGRDILDIQRVEQGAFDEARDGADDWFRQLSADSGSRHRPEIEEALELARTVLRQYTTTG